MATPTSATNIHTASIRASMKPNLNANMLIKNAKTNVNKPLNNEIAITFNLLKVGLYKMIKSIEAIAFMASGKSIV